MADPEPEMTLPDGMKVILLEQIARGYLESRDFNGVDAALLTDAVKEFPVDADVLLAELVAEGAVYGDFIAASSVIPSRTSVSTTWGDQRRDCSHGSETQPRPGVLNEDRPESGPHIGKAIHKPL